MSAASLRILDAAAAAANAGDIPAASRLIAKLDGVGGEAEARAQAWLGDQAMRNGRLSEAEPHLKRAVALWPELAESHLRLALLYAFSGQGWRGLPHAEAAAVRGVFTVETLLLLAHADVPLPLPVDFDSIRDEDADPYVLLGRAHLARSERDVRAAERCVQLAEEHGAPPAEVLMAKALNREQSGEDLGEFLLALTDQPPTPDYWRLLGRTARGRCRTELAIGCFAEALRLLPDDLTTAMLLVETLPRDHPASPALSARTRQLQMLRQDLRTLAKTRDNSDSYRPVVERLVELGHYLEAIAWTDLAARPRGKQRWMSQSLASALPRFTPRTGRVAANSVSHLFKKIAVPDATAVARLSREGRAGEIVSRTGSAVGFRFTEDAAKSGLNFQYRTRADASRTGRRMHEFTGGGVAATDLNGDGRPDLYFTQATAGITPTPAAGEPPGDQLFLNLGGRAWRDVSRQCGVASAAFGQGVTSGDYDGDGFADLYVGRIGRNALLLNNGDGTYRDASWDVGLDTAVWTTSVCLADLNGDGAADLMDVNYLTGEGLFTQVCSTPDGHPMACAPISFPSEPDAVLFGDGAGGVQQRSTEAGFTTLGNGLGVVAGRFSVEPRTVASLDVYVANDMTANLLYAGPRERVDRPFEEEAIFRGVAFNDRANAEAGMGIAAGDPDGDGDADLFVTNFYSETNTLYRQGPSGNFSDATAAMNLERPGFDLLAFGTQFLDVDGDGRDDLILTNGHVDEQRGIPFRMRPLLFRNAGDRFEEASDAGAYFEGEYLGRSLSRLDWNGDGRPDAVVSHMDAPTALLTNRTQGRPQVAVRVVSLRSHRDAVGSIVDAEFRRADGTVRTARQFRFAGDGYQCSNEPVLRFGRGAGDRLRSLTVRWPSGKAETFPPGEEGTRMLVEGSGRTVSLP